MEKKQKWVSWFKLVNKSKHQTLDELREFLIIEGLSDGNNASPKAFQMGVAKIIDGKERWNLNKYISIMKRAKKKAKKDAKN